MSKVTSIDALNLAKLKALEKSKKQAEEIEANVRESLQEAYQALDDKVAWLTKLELTAQELSPSAVVAELIDEERARLFDLVAPAHQATGQKSWEAEGGKLSIRTTNKVSVLKEKDWVGPDFTARRYEDIATLFEAKRLAHLTIAPAGLAKTLPEIELTTGKKLNTVELVTTRSLAVTHNK
jgi:hypothetical protein